MGHGRLAVDDAATGGDHCSAEFECEHVPFLDGEELVQALSVDDLLQPPAFGGLDEYVGIDEVTRQRLGQEDAHCALARSGHSDEDDVLIVGHGVRLAHGVKRVYVRLRHGLKPILRLVVEGLLVPRDVPV